MFFPGPLIIPVAKRGGRIIYTQTCHGWQGVTRNFGVSEAILLGETPTAINNDDSLGSKVTKEIDPS